jgi:hypothetical protein
VQFAQVLRYIWTRESMRTDEGIEAWVEAMVYAVDNAKYMLEGGKFGKTHYLPERFDGRFFRIHDSGDFFSRQYLAAWKAIADALPDITFWAPSRYWATGNGIEQVNEINGDPRNLIIRPSAYHTNEPPPRDLGPGWATGSAVFGSVGDHELTVQQAAAGSDYGAFNWECQAPPTAKRAAACAGCALTSNPCTSFTDGTAEENESRQARHEEDEARHEGKPARLPRLRQPEEGVQDQAAACRSEARDAAQLPLHDAGQALRHLEEDAQDVSGAALLQGRSAHAALLPQAEDAGPCPARRHTAAGTAHRQ